MVRLRERAKHQEGATKVKNSMAKYRGVSMEGKRKTRSSMANEEIISSASELSRSTEDLKMLIQSNHLVSP